MPEEEEPSQQIEQIRENWTTANTEGENRTFLDSKLSICYTEITYISINAVQLFHAFMIT